MQNITAPNLLVNDFMAGVGEVGVAAVRVKVSEAAKQCGVRVFYWGCDERRIFGEVARARTSGRALAKPSWHGSWLCQDWSRCKPRLR